MIRLTGSPIYSTSVNYSGQEVFTDIHSIIGEFESSVSLIIDAGELTGLPSTIVDISSETPHVLRQGALHFDR